MTGLLSFKVVVRHFAAVCLIDAGLTAQLVDLAASRLLNDDSIGNLLKNVQSFNDIFVD